ncbi:hypothetical protein DMUE_4068 [Dictyocoela muelleri]|nr:hypothetical protein DMUE_4068 [Dictyocoela muelleri]
MLNKSYFNKNIFISYFSLNSSYSSNYVNLNSKTEKENILSEIEYLSYNTTLTPTRYIQVDCNIPNTELKIKRDLPLFDTLSIDIFQAINTFRNTVSLTQWDETTIFNVFKSLCSDEILTFIKPFNDKIKHSKKY